MYKLSILHIFLAMRFFQVLYVQLIFAFLNCIFECDVAFSEIEGMYQRDGSSSLYRNRKNTSMMMIENSKTARVLKGKNPFLPPRNVIVSSECRKSCCPLSSSLSFFRSHCACLRIVPVRLHL